MRAAIAAKAQAGAYLGAVEKLESFVPTSANEEYAFQSALPLLKLCLSVLVDSKPSKAQAGAYLATWLAEQCGAPEDSVKELRTWLAGGTVSDPCVTPDAELAPRPPSSRPSPDVSPKQKMVRSRGGSKELESMEVPPYPDGDKKPHGIVRSARPSVHDEDDQDDGDGQENPAPPPMPQGRRISFWQAGATAEPEEEEDEEDDLEHTNRFAALRRSLAPASEGQGKSMKMRRFTVSLTSKTIDRPPWNIVESVMRTNPMFADLDDTDLMKLYEKMRCNVYEADETVVPHGCQVEDLHMVFEGRGKVSVPHQVGKLDVGETFGEECLRLAGSVAETQVSAMGGPLTTLSISAAEFTELQTRKNKLNKTSQGRKARQRNDGVDSSRKRGSALDSDNCPCSFMPILKDYKPTPQDRELIITAVKNNKVLGEVLQLSEKQFEMIADSVHLIQCHKDAVLMRKGERGTALFIVQDGFMDVSISSDTSCEFRVRTGDSFGELGLLYDTPRTATISAPRDCKLWVLPRYEFRVVIRLSYSSRITEYTKLISKIPAIVNAVDSQHIDMIAGILEEISFLEGEEVCVAGEDGGLLFIVYDGECKMDLGDGTTRVLKPGDWIGEKALTSNHPASETVTCLSEEAILLALDTSSFQMVTKALAEMQRTQVKMMSSNMNCKDQDGLIPHLDHLDKEKFADKFLQKRLVRYQKRAKFGGSQGARNSDYRVSLCDGNLEDGIPEGEEHSLQRLERIGALGEGSFGTVLLMKDKVTQMEYAVKGLNKEHMVREHMGASCAMERSVMLLLDSEFIVRLYKTFQDSHTIYFMLEPVLGGELFDVYNDAELFGELGHAKFYIGCVTLGLQHMHLKRVIYRDLKFENCILDLRGYLKLTDMGISKVVIGKTYTVVGTADYFAPETLRQVGHNRAADWWACGVLLFIMVSGRSPFDAPEVTQVYKNIIKGFSKVKFPKTFPSDLTDTVKSLCRKKPEERVTMQKGGVDNLKQMGFFTGMDWQQLQLKTITPPYVPPPISMEKLQSKKLEREIEIRWDKVQEWDGSLPEA